MSDIVDDELWDELRDDIAPPPPPPPTRYADRSDYTLEHLARQTYRDFARSRSQRDCFDLKEMISEMKRRGWDEARMREVVT